MLQGRSWQNILKPWRRTIQSMIIQITEYCIVLYWYFSNSIVYMYKHILKLFLQWNFFGGPTRIRLTFVCFYLTTIRTRQVRLSLIHCTLLKPTFPYPIRTAHDGCTITQKIHGHNARDCCTFLWVVGSWTSLVNKFPSKKSPNVITADNCFGHYEQCIRFSFLTTKNIQADVRANKHPFNTRLLSVIRKSKNWENM